MGASPTTGFNNVKTETFNVGITNVIYTVTDIQGLTDTCSFQVWIKNIVAPEFKITCPDSTIVVDADAGECEADILVPSPAINNPCNETYTITNDSPYKTNDTIASGTYPVGETVVTWTIIDASGSIYHCIQTITVNDLMPVLSCPPNITEQADYEAFYKSNLVVPPPVYSDNCPHSILTWTLTPPTGYESYYQPGDLSGTGEYLSPDTFYVGVTLIAYTFTDANGHTVTCSFTITILSKPEIDCLADIVTTTDEGECSATLDPGVPTLIEGAQPITWTWTIAWPDASTIVDSGSSTTTALNPTITPIGPYPFKEGTSTITWRAENISGFEECSQTVTVTDDEPPTITAPGPFEFCVEDLSIAQFNGSINLNYTPDYPSADYYLVKTGSTELDLNLATYSDNCCSLTDGYSIRWTIIFNGSEPAVSGIGQPSTYGANIPLWGDGVNYLDRVHTITYWITDCNGNESSPVTVNITVKPRPNLIKVNE
jgi:hypothetical protein